jgi:hypothetical protein
MPPMPALVVFEEGYCVGNLMENCVFDLVLVVQAGESARKCYLLLPVMTASESPEGMVECELPCL